jgi:hypothetical protein
MRSKAILLVFLTSGLLCGLALAGFALAGAAAPAKVQKLSATLTAAQEVGGVKAPGATGQFKATLDGRSLTWKLTFGRLTGQATAAHVHLGKKGVAGAVAVPLCGPCTSGAHGTVKVTAAVAAALGKGRTYANVHTAKNPNGEIRGQVEGGNAASSSPAGTATTGTSTGGGYDPGGGYGSGDDDGY